MCVPILRSPAAIPDSRFAIPESRCALAAELLLRRRPFEAASQIAAAHTSPKVGAKSRPALARARRWLVAVLLTLVMLFSCAASVGAPAPVGWAWRRPPLGHKCARWRLASPIRAPGAAEPDPSGARTSRGRHLSAEAVGSRAAWSRSRGRPARWLVCFGRSIGVGPSSRITWRAPLPAGVAQRSAALFVMIVDGGGGVLLFRLAASGKSASISWRRANRQHCTTVCTIGSRLRRAAAE